VSLTIIHKLDLEGFIENLQQEYRVAGPVRRNGGFTFDWVSPAQEMHLGYPTTILPPKKYLLPPKEVLLEFGNGSHGKPRAVKQAEPTVIFGVHTCDLHAIHLLDVVFSTGNIDPHYLKRREQTLIVSIECLIPCDEHSFCKSMGTLTADEGYDLHLTDLGESYAVDVGTEAGGMMLEKFAKTRTPNSEDIHKLNAVLSEKWPKFPYRLEFDVSDLPSLLNLSMKSPVWTELGETCLSCAACTNVCPTCFCFDVKDEVELDLQRGKRVRVWDSCQLDQFATVAGGHNFRKSRALRQRHRFMRKGKYILDAHQYLGCVGCGRCARACLVNITPVTVFNELFRQQEVGESQ
jgi:sulfhydrogenase subunit beta (sulfur reductase)